MGKWGKRIVWGVAIVGLSVAVAGLALESLIDGMERADQEMPLASVDVDGDALSALVVVRLVARTAGSPEFEDDKVPDGGAPPPEPGVDRLRAQVAAAAMEDWRLLALLSAVHRADPPLPEGAIPDRLLEIAGDNAYVRLVLMRRSVHCCSQRRDDAARQALASTRWASPKRDLMFALDRRFRGVPASRFSLVMPDDVRDQLALTETFFAAMRVDDAAFHFLLDHGDPSPDVLVACRHIARLMLSDADWGDDVREAVKVLERFGNDAERAEAARRASELEWLQWNHGELEEADSVLLYEEKYRFAPFGDLVALRALMAEAGVAPAPPPGWTWPRPEPAASP